MVEQVPNAAPAEEEKKQAAKVSSRSPPSIA